ncbi:MAG: branched-chain amino acid ABC transporter permease [Dehalococcoidia bacterium]|nr:branched-chain amino acid ABC transporter permease [Dehalococcoidia bacterium]
METFFAQLANGASTGALYGLLALALVFIFRATDVVNFAQGEMAMFSTYLGWSISRPLSLSWIPFLGVDRHLNLLTWRPEVFGLPLYLGSENDGLTRLGYLVVLVVTVAIAFVMGALIERLLIRPSEGKNLLNAVIVTLGIFAFLNSLANFRYGPVPQTYPAPFRGDAVDFGLFKMSQHSLFALVVAAVLMIAVYVFFQRTKLGLGVRAAALNPSASQLMGINTGRMLTLGWALAAAIGCVAGMLIAPALSGISPNLMFGILLYGFAAAVLGGLDSALGAVVGGIAVGVGQSMVVQYVGSQWSDIIAFGLIIAILMVRPTGLFGAPAVKKV